MRPPTAMATANEPSGALLIASWIAVFAGTVLALAGQSWVMIAHGLLLDGQLAMLWVLAAAGIGAGISRIQHESKCLTFATNAALGLGVMSIITLSLGLAGWMNRTTGIGIIAVGLLAGAVRIIPWLQRTNLSAPSIAHRYWAWLIVAPIAGLAVVCAFVPAGLLWGAEPHPYDVLEYHLQIPREWFELGRIVPLHHNVFSYFPFNVEMHYLLAMYLRGGPWEGMYLAQLMHLSMVALTVLAIAGVARHWVAILVACVPWMTLVGTIAYNEGGLLLFGTLAIVWMMHADGKLWRYVLAGAFAGFACGTKLTAVPLLLVGLPLAGLAMRIKLKHTCAFGLAGVITLSPWLIRNSVWTGNPVFPMATSVFGRAHFTPEQVERFDRAHGPAESQRGIAPKVAALWRQVVYDWRFGWLLLPLAMVGALMKRDAQSLFLAVIAGILLVFWLGLTHLQGRFFILAITIAALLLARAPEQRWLIAAGLGAAVIGVVTTVYQLKQIDERMARQTGGVGPLSVIGGDGIDRCRSPLLVDIPEESTLVLVGGAEAFFYHKPMSHLRYRTVFDVDVHDNDLIKSWLADSAGPGDVVLVDPSELKRFGKTYSGIPAYAGDETEPFLLRR